MTRLLVLRLHISHVEHGHYSFLACNRAETSDGRTKVSIPSIKRSDVIDHPRKKRKDRKRDEGEKQRASPQINNNPNNNGPHKTTITDHLHLFTSDTHKHFQYTASVGVPGSMKHHLGRFSSSPYVRFCFYVLVSSSSAAATVAAFSPTTTTTTTNSVVAAATSYSRQHFTRRFMFGGSNNNNQNPLDLVSNLFGAAAKMTTSTSGIDETTVREVQQELENLAIFDWNQVQAHLESKMTTPEERNFRANLSKGYGVMGSPLHKIRLYDESNREEDIRVVFYRDSASKYTTASLL